jgi:Spy/CpxP family protein refolding chaperone
MKISKIAFAWLFVAIATPALAQVQPFGQINPAGQLFTPFQKKLTDGLSGTWWRNKNNVALLSLTAEQQQKMDDVVQQFRIKLIDLTATLDKEEAILEPLMKAERLDEIKVGMQIDKVADARAELEKVNARMLLGIRVVLTPEQWAKLNSSKKGFYYNSTGKAIYKSK